MIQIKWTKKTKNSLTRCKKCRKSLIRTIIFIWNFRVGIGNNIYFPYLEMKTLNQKLQRRRRNNPRKRAAKSASCKKKRTKKNQRRTISLRRKNEDFQCRTFHLPCEKDRSCSSLRTFWSRPKLIPSLLFTRLLFTPATSTWLDSIYLIRVVRIVKKVMQIRSDPRNFFYSNFVRLN